MGLIIKGPPSQGYHHFPYECMEYLPYIYYKCMVTVGKYSIHGASGDYFTPIKVSCLRPGYVGEITATYDHQLRSLPWTP